MAGKDPLLILHELNSDFHRSKKEQIDRFLRDQDDLNKRFADCSINEDPSTIVAPVEVEDDDGDDSSDDVESQFNLRLDTFRVRPLSARIGSWSLEEDANKSPNKPFATVKISNNDNAAAAQPTVVDQKEYQKYARDRSSSRDRKASSKPKTRPNGVRDRNKSKDLSIRTDKSHEQKTDEQTNENQPQKLLTRRRHRPRTAMGLQIANNDDGTAMGEPTSPKKEGKSSAALGTGPSSSRRPLRASAPAAPSRQPAAGWETAEEMKRNTFLERQSVVRGGRESPAPHTVGASVAALHHRSRQQELLASSVSNVATNTSMTDPTSTLRSSLSFGSSTPRAGGGKDPSGWASLTGTPRHTTRNKLGADSVLSGNKTRAGNSSQHQPTSSSSQGVKGLSHRKVGQGGPSEGGAVRTKVSLIKLPRLEGTLPKTMLQPKESAHGLVANTPTG